MKVRYFLSTLAVFGLICTAACSRSEYQNHLPPGAPAPGGLALSGGALGGPGSGGDPLASRAGGAMGGPIAGVTPAALASTELDYCHSPDGATEYTTAESFKLNKDGSKIVDGPERPTVYLKLRDEDKNLKVYALNKKDEHIIRFKDPSGRPVEARLICGDWHRYNNVIFLGDREPVFFFDGYKEDNLVMPFDLKGDKKVAVYAFQFNPGEIKKVPLSAIGDPNLVSDIFGACACSSRNLKFPPGTNIVD